MHSLLSDFVGRVLYRREYMTFFIASFFFQKHSVLIYLSRGRIMTDGVVQLVHEKLLCHNTGELNIYYDVIVYMRVLRCHMSGDKKCLMLLMCKVMTSLNFT